MTTNIEKKILNQISDTISEAHAELASEKLDRHFAEAAPSTNLEELYASLKHLDRLVRILKAE